MPGYEYKIVPAPRKGEKAKGVKTPEARFAHAVETAINALASEGWEYLRADFLPCDERSGLTGSTTQWRNLLVFRRPTGGADFAARPLAVPADGTPVAQAVPPPGTPDADRPEPPGA